MNIDTSSSSTAVSSTSSSSSTSSVQSNSKSSKTDSSSFAKEMKSASSKDEQVNEKNENPSEDKVEVVDDKNTQTANKEQNDSNKNNKEDDLKTVQTLKGELNYNDFEFNDNTSILNRNIQSLINTGGLISFNNTDFSTLTASIDYQTVSMDINDAMFFTDLVQNTDMSMQSISSTLQQMASVNVQAAEKTANVSTTMMNLLSDSMKTNQPFRIDFDKDISVIIKVSKDGSIMANFIPGDKAVEEYLKNNIGFLRQRFDDENLPYNQLSYSKHKQQQEQPDKQKKENADE